MTIKLRRCYYRKSYLVGLNKFVNDRYGNGFANYISTPFLGRARYFAKRLPLKIRQIDVRERGKRTYVLKGSWL